MLRSNPFKSLLFGFLVCFSTVMYAKEVSISCGINNSNGQLDVTDCIVTPDEAFSQPAQVNLLKTIKDIRSCEASSTKDNSFSCLTSVGSFVCEKGDGNVALCTLPGNVDVECSSDDGEGIGCKLTLPDEGSDEVKVLERVARSAPARKVAGVIGDVCYAFSGSSDFQRDCGLLIDDQEKSAELLDRITPRSVYLSTKMARQSVFAGLRNITQRLNSRRHGDGFSAGNLMFKTDTGLLSFNTLLDQYGGGASADAVLPGIADGGRLSSFVNGIVVLGEMSESENRIASDFDTLGVTAGLDYRVTHDSLLGVAFGYASTASDMAGDRGKLDSNSYSMTVYGTVYGLNEFYFDGALSYSGSDYAQERYISGSLGGTPVKQTARADYFGSQASLSLGGGYDKAIGALSIGGYGQLVHLLTKIDGYEESASDPGKVGAGLAALTISDHEQTSLTLNIGGQVSYSIDRSWGVFQPMARIEWVNELKDDQQLVSGRFAADRVVKKTFTLPGDKLDSSYFNLGLGFTALRPNGNSMFVYYQATAGYEDLTENMITAGIRWEI